MGNAAVARRQRATELSYDELSNVFSKTGPKFPAGADPDDFKIVFLQAVVEEKLDCLELMLVWGRDLMNTSIFPVHLAAREGKLEALELFISAGLLSSAEQLNDHGESPLHCCATNRSLDSALCASLLVQHGKLSALRVKSVPQEDSCFHVAAAHNNARFVQSALSSLEGASKSDLQKLLAQKNAAGRTPYSVSKASILQNNDVLEVFESIRQQQTALYDQVFDQARIMAVWERFFENAARKMAGEDFVDVDRNEDADPLQSQLIGDGGRALKIVKSVQSAVIDEITLEFSSKMRDFWQHILCFEGGHAWYVIHKMNGESLWLSDFLRKWSSFFYSPGELQRLESSGRDHAQLPTSIASASRGAWMNYFDHVSSHSFFMNVRTWKVEQYLPLGTGASDVGLICYGDSEWVETDQLCNQSWIQVIINHDLEAHSDASSSSASPSWNDWPSSVSSTAAYYFWNRITGHKVWLPPPNWCDGFPEGWVICAEDGQLEHMWWYNTETEEAVWCEAIESCS